MFEYGLVLPSVGNRLQSIDKFNKSMAIILLIYLEIKIYEGKKYYFLIKKYKKYRKYKKDRRLKFSVYCRR
ncbi:hypothetical protein BpHYR1_046030 [Brachionus plicatilis]|uniref:Uncharacterized protein n=1 Tax=Brachionus plicatilis TaxID=10195 RepID=A0A3M7SC35_BRAPC|nr:hypothetical protein BpHYR1_046030 [Brachionus plicatilis]